MEREETNTALLEKTERNYGIDALRILSMLMVVVLHILLAGGVLELTGTMARDQYTGQFMTAWFLECAAYCAVNSYGLISGYVGVTGRYRFSNLAVLWLRVVFYTVGISVLVAILRPGYVDGDSWRDAVFPVMRRHYWYFTAYTGLFLFIPALNAAVDRLGRKRLGVMLAGAVILFSCLPTLFSKDTFSLGKGYTVWWLMILYLIGGYIRKYGLFRRTKGLWLLAGYLVSVVVSWAWKMLNYQPMGPLTTKIELLSYTSPTILAAGVFLLLAFERARVPGVLRRIIRFFAPLAFSVYLMHTQKQMWEHLVVKRFSAYGLYPALGEAAAVLGTALAIFVGCALIDAVRERLFAALKLKERLTALEERLLWSGRD